MNRIVSIPSPRGRWKEIRTVFCVGCGQAIRLTSRTHGGHCPRCGLTLKQQIAEYTVDRVATC